MTARATVNQTDDGWRIELTEVESGVIETHDSTIIIRIDPDADDQAPTPLAVSLEA